MDAATVLWLPAAAEHAQADAPARRALDEWGRARGVRLVEAEDAAGPALPIDLSLTDDVEADLSHAHDAITAGDTAAAERALARADALLRLHPELPNAAWLMAEVDRAWSARWSRLSPPDEERAGRAWRRAAALDGGRAAGVGETLVPADRPVEASLVLVGDGSASLDGVATAAGTLHVVPGEHLLTVNRRGVPVWSEWVTIAGGGQIRVAIPEPVPCSKEDLARATLQGGIVDARAVRCGSWILAAPVTDELGVDAVRVASCEGGRCGALVEWRVGRRHEESPRTPETPGRHFPAWAAWTIAGVGVALAAVGVTLLATGAFHPQTQTQFVSGGEHVTSLVPFAKPGARH